MPGRSSKLGSALLLAASVCCASTVQAHFPLPRVLSVAADGSSVALSLPGFGLLVRGDAAQPFAYACDALLDVAPTNATPTLARRADGTLLLGTSSGLRAVSASGCPLPLEGALRSEPVFALALLGNDAYAVAGMGVWRSMDAGESWELRAPLASAEQVTAVLIDPSDPTRVHLSRGTAVLSSSDSGASFSTTPRERAITLLHAQSSSRWWALERSAMAAGNRGFDVLRAEAPQGPWTPVLEVKYFGGLTVDAQGVVWVGDDFGGVYRSDNGTSFRQLAPELPVACVTAASDGLYACTDGDFTDPAISRLARSESAESVLTFAQAGQMVSCPGQDVARTCAAAWVEWQRDVLMRKPDGGADADAGVDAAVDAAVDPGGTVIDAGADAATRDRPTVERGDDGCALASGRGGAWWAMLALASRRRRKR
jgi:hypothetical protein